ncbi:hypothetical protein ABIE52_006823 [Rhodococcus sp. OAS809]|uniref:hypothetical protein n=1 Tax=Rhodococcus sp. OAS809 TaxID=2663874 RepID=UPI001789A6BC
MTDHITADELRTAAKVAFAYDDRDNARAYERAAAKAESNNAPDPATKLAIDLGRAALEASDSVAYGSGVEAHHRAAGEAVIEFSQQNCRPLLTAGQIEDIRTVMAAAKPSGVLAHRLNTMLSLHEHVTPIAPVATKCTICDTPELCHFPRHHPFTTELGPLDDAGNDRVSEPVADLRVHNHEPYRGAGPDGHCPERTVDGRLRGACMTHAASGEIRVSTGNPDGTLTSESDDCDNPLDPGDRYCASAPVVEESKTESAGGFDLTALIDQVARVTWDERQKNEISAGRWCLDWKGLGRISQELEHVAIRAALAELQQLGLLTLPSATDTGPWHTVAEIPDTVTSVFDGGDDRWCKSEGKWYLADITEIGDRFAPFTATEKG